MLDEPNAVEPLGPDDPLRSLFDGVGSTVLPPGVRDRVQTRLAASLGASAVLAEPSSAASSPTGSGAASSGATSSGATSMGTATTGSAGASPVAWGGSAALTATAIGTVGAALLASSLWARHWFEASETPLRRPDGAAVQRSEQHPRSAPPASTLPLPPPSSTGAPASSSRLDLTDLPTRGADAKKGRPSGSGSEAPASVESSLAREVRLLRQAQRLAATDPKAAVQVLDDYAHEFPNGELIQESVKLRDELQEDRAKGELP